MRWADQYNVMRSMLLSSPATHWWVRDLILRLDAKDPEVVARLMRMRHEAVRAGEWDQLECQKPTGDDGISMKD